MGAHIEPEKIKGANEELETKLLTFKARLDWPGYGPKGNAKVVRIVSSLSKERVSADAQKTLVSRYRSHPILYTRRKFCLSLLPTI